MIILDHTPSDLAQAHNIEVSLDEMNPGEFTAVAFLAGTAVASIGITGIVAPSVAATGLAGAGIAGLAGYKRRHGHLPFMGDKEAPAPTPGQVTDTAGTPVAVASL